MLTSFHKQFKRRRKSRYSVFVNQGILYLYFLTNRFIKDKDIRQTRLQKKNSLMEGKKSIALLTYLLYVINNPGV